MTSPALVATLLDSKFRIERALASGAGGDVYEATHLTLGSRVAVKVLRDGDAAGGEARRRRFMHEARVAAGIQSEHVVRVFDFAAHEGGLTYIVMELLEGETLAQRARRVGPLPLAEAVDYVLQAATPLALLHERGIVHRDVKPSNLFLARDSDGKERLKLLDFGVAAFRRSVSESSFSFSAGRGIVGTPRYMAPEQVRASEGIDGRADVWALGVTLYELLAGTPPFDAQSVVTLLRQIERTNPVPLRHRRPAVPPALAALVHSCLEKDPARRPPNARALVEALAALRGSLQEARVDETAPGDALDLSWNDPDVQELRPVRRGVRRRAIVTGSLLAACVITIALAGQRTSRAPSPQAVASPLAASTAPVDEPVARSTPARDDRPLTSTPSAAPASNAASARRDSSPTSTKAPPPASRAARKAQPAHAAPAKSPDAPRVRDDDVPLE